MDKLGLVKFEQDKYKLFKQDNQILMSLEELGKAIDYSTRAQFEKFLLNNSHLLEHEFSFLMKVDNLENGIIKKREKRFFTEQGIYEVSLLANTEKAKSFRKFARGLITAYRKGNLVSKEIPRDFEFLNTKIDKMLAIVEGTNEIVKNSEEAEASYLEGIEALNLKLEALERVEGKVDTLVKLYDKVVKVVNDHEKRIGLISETLTTLLEELTEKGDIE